MGPAGRIPGTPVWPVRFTRPVPGGGGKDGRGNQGTQPAGRRTAAALTRLPACVPSNLMVTYGCMTRPDKPDPRVAERNPERTRERILSAALKEFAANGFAGARVDAIARRAAINKRMLYHYFGNKEHLFREVLRLKMAERQAWAE